MSFQRSEFYGLDFKWYAVDEADTIAQLSTGFSPMPRQLFADEAAYEATVDYFPSLKDLCTSFLSKGARKKQERGQANYSIFLQYAARGLYAYGEENYGPLHNPYTIPEVPLLLSALPNPVACFVAQFRVSLRFADQETIDSTAHFDCET